MDDFLTSASLREECITLIQKVMRVLQTRGFKLTKWMSNDREVMKSIPKEHWAKDVQELDLSSDNVPTERALGVQYGMQNRMSSVLR